MLFATVFLSVLVSVSADHHWSYEDRDWTKSFPTCGKDRQSPIDLIKYYATCDKSLSESLTITNYDSTSGGDFTMKNTGHTLKIETPPKLGANISLKEVTFKLAQLHFHWGSDNSKGSEHVVDSRKYPAELHLVHFNPKYGSLENAVNKKDGLAVLGIFIEVGAENAAYKNFLNFTKYNVTYNGSSAAVPAFALKDLLPEDKKSFYRYPGSLTTPPCYESVTWTVFMQTVTISQDQLNEFRSLKNGAKAIVDNYRTNQPLNKRRVTYFQADDCPSGGSLLRVSLLFTALLSISLYFSFF